MPFQLTVSNSLTHLAEKLASQIKQSQTIFQPIYIITQTEGMNNWLKLQIAERLGISANIQFVKPNDIIHKIYFQLGGQFTQSLSAHDLNWLLFKILGEEEFILKFPEIAAYYHYDRLDKDVKRLALAEKIADLFDQYQIYRADMIEEWNNTNQLNASKEWQKYLWVRAKQLAGENFPDKTIIGKYIINQLENSRSHASLKEKIPAIYLFGLSLITEYHLQIFHAIAMHIEMEFFILNPAPNDYWFEEKSEKIIDFLKYKDILPQSEQVTANPLLTGWGKIIQDTFLLLFKDENLLNNYDEYESEEPQEDTLLHKIQSSIYHNQKEDVYFSEVDLKDGSITINSCFSPAREVEVLYNYLVHLIDQKKEDLSARDIVVMVNDIDLYASYIKAVFDNAPYKFYYTIADERYAVSDSISNTLISLLTLNEQQFTAENVVRLLEFSSIRKHFQLQDINRIREIVDAANIRFGIAGNRNDDSDYLSWKYGLQRIMYGLCMSGEQEFGQGDSSFFPLDQVEGFESFDMVRFMAFLELLMASLADRKPKKTIVDWVRFVEKLIGDFIGNNEDATEEDFILLMNQLNNYNALQDVFEEQISYEVFLYNFLPTLSEAKRSNAFAGGGITFCSLIPMRSIPFKVVALLGINFDKFPRKDQKVSFDLMQKEKRKGDRNIKDNDKHLFLETLLSAEKYLYLSYIGQNIKDNSNLPPSVFVDELLDFIESNADVDEDFRHKMITKHPLHGFSNKYNSGNQQLYSYFLNRKPTKQLSLKENADATFDFKEIDLNKMIQFLKDPVKGYYNSVLGINYDVEELSLKDTEIFGLDHLDKWSLKNQLLNKDSAENQILKNQKVKTGSLPLKNMANVVLQTVDEEIQTVKSIYDALVQDEMEQQVAVNIEFPEWKLRGSVASVFGNKLIVTSFSKSENKYLLDAYIRYLALRATGNDIELHFISQNKEADFVAQEINQKTALSNLAAIVEVFKKGHEEILCFSTQFNLSPNKILDLNEVEFKKVIDKKFEEHNMPNNDAYMVKAFKDGIFNSSKWQDYQEIAEVLLVPLVEGFPNYFS